MVMFNAEKYYQMAPEQYSSWKEKSAGIQCLNKWLLYDYAWYTHHPLTVCSNDAKSCYDCIVLIVAALCLCHLGAPKPEVQSMVTTLHKMQHHVQSTYGDSNQLQGWQKWASLIAGTSQGNGAGPQIWAAISSPLFQILTTEGFIAQVISAISGHECSLLGFGFVNDVDLCITVQNNNLVMVMEKMQNSLQMWARLLQATDGTLIPDKCFRYYVHNQWETGSWKYAKPSPQYWMQVPDNQGWLITIWQLRPSEARRTLGVHFAPDGNNNAEANYPTEVAKHWPKLMAG